MRWFAPLLFPFAIVYDAITSVRNRLYDTGVKPVAKFDIPLISVGNLSVGGTGKTPMIEYLIRLLSPAYNIATLSRGYGRKTRGIRLASEVDNASSIGDEPFQFFRKFRRKVVVAVGEDRALAIPYILHERPEINLMLLDDAFQHRRVLPSFQILLTDYHNLFVKDLLLPAGRLRESKRGVGRADVIVVTKCPPTITDDEMIFIESSIRKYTKKPVFFGRVTYGNLLPMSPASPYKFEKVVLVSGIANPSPLEQYLRRDYQVIKHFNFPDHHPYSSRDIEEICDAATRAGAVVVTTEKDAVKMDASIFQNARLSLYYLPIEVEFVKNGKEFDEMVLNAARTHAR